MAVDRHKVTDLALATCVGIIVTGVGAWLLRGNEIERLRAEMIAYSDRAVATTQAISSANLSNVALTNDKNSQAITRLTQITDSLADTVARQNIETAKLTEQIKILVTPR
jgi:hypothetical protein